MLATSERTRRLARIGAVYLVASSPTVVAGGIAALVLVGHLPRPLGLVALVTLAFYPFVSGAAVRTILRPDDQRAIADVVHDMADQESGLAQELPEPGDPVDPLELELREDLAQIRASSVPVMPEPLRFLRAAGADVENVRSRVMTFGASSAPGSDVEADALAAAALLFRADIVLAKLERRLDPEGGDVIPGEA